MENIRMPATAMILARYLSYSQIHPIGLYGDRILPGRWLV